MSYVCCAQVILENLWIPTCLFARINQLRCMGQCSCDILWDIIGVLKYLAWYVLLDTAVRASYTKNKKSNHFSRLDYAVYILYIYVYMNIYIYIYNMYWVSRIIYNFEQFGQCSPKHQWLFLPTRGICLEYPMLFEWKHFGITSLTLPFFNHQTTYIWTIWPKGEN